MKKIFIISVFLFMTAVVACFGLSWARVSAQALSAPVPPSSSGGVPGISSPAPASEPNNPVLPASDISDEAGTASEILGTIPTGPTLVLGTASGNVTVNNFYEADPPDTFDGVLILKLTQNYLIVYDPSDSSFWLAVTGTPFTTWQTAAEQDLLSTLGIGESDACKLSVTAGVIYGPGNPENGVSLPLSFCQ
jgi:hypothetical protein